jgi:hypothetical protein
VADILRGLFDKCQSPEYLEHLRAPAGAKIELRLYATRKSAKAGEDQAILLEVTGSEVWVLDFPPGGKLVHVALDSTT